KPNDKAGHYFHPIALDFLYLLDQVAAVLRLLRLLKALGDRCFNSQEYSVEAGTSHVAEQRVIVSEIHAGLGKQLKRIAVTFLPFGQLRQKLSHALLVTNEVVIHDEYRPTPANAPQRIELVQHLLIALSPRNPAVD